MMEIGRICVKTAGRDAGQRCVIVDIVNDIYVMIDGQTRARKCNIRHLEPTNQIIEISRDASHEDVVKAFKKLGLKLEAKEKKEKTEKGPRPKKARKAKEPKEKPKK